MYRGKRKSSVGIQLLTSVADEYAHKRFFLLKASDDQQSLITPRKCLLLHSLTDFLTDPLTKKRHLLVPPSGGTLARDLTNVSNRAHSLVHFVFLIPFLTSKFGSSCMRHALHAARENQEIAERKKERKKESASVSVSFVRQAAPSADPGFDTQKYHCDFLGFICRQPLCVSNKIVHNVAVASEPRGVRRERCWQDPLSAG